MSYSIRIYTKSAPTSLYELVKDFAEEGAYFENAVLIAVGSGASIQYEESRQPIVFELHDEDDYLKKQVKELLFVLEVSKASSKKDFLTKELPLFKHVVVIKLDTKDLTEDAWEFLDNLEGFIASEFDGLIHTDDEMFYDKELKKIYKL
jgi:hypothetical protein